MLRELFLLTRFAPSERRAVVGIAIGVIFAFGELQAAEPEFIRHLDSSDRFIQIPPPPEIHSGTWSQGGVEVQVTHDASGIVVRARTKGKERVAILSMSDPHRRIVFDKRQIIFLEMHSSIRIGTSDATVLERLIDLLDATGGDRYPALGYSMIRLPTAVDPVDAAKLARRSGLVSFAEIVLVRPRHVPM